MHGLTDADGQEIDWVQSTIKSCRYIYTWVLKFKLKPIYLLSGSQSEPSPTIFAPLYSTRSTTTGALLLICLPEE